MQHALLTLQDSWDANARTFFLPALPSHRFARWPRAGTASLDGVMPKLRGPWDDE